MPAATAIQSGSTTQKRKRNVKANPVATADIKGGRTKVETRGAKSGLRAKKELQRVESSGDEEEDENVATKPSTPRKNAAAKAYGKKTLDKSPQSLETPRKRRKQVTAREVNFDKTLNLSDPDGEAAEKPKKRKVAKEEEEDEASVQGEEDPGKKVKRRRKTKEEKEAEAMPLAARTTGLRMFVGAHVSGAKGALRILDVGSKNQLAQAEI